MSGCALAVFARAPLPGSAKTRLIPALGAAGAAGLARRMLEATLAQAVAAGIGPVTLYCTPNTADATLHDAAAHHGVALAEQGCGDLGARMQRALLAGLETGISAMVIGTDCPSLDAATLRRAAEKLACHAAVFVPATDGGYVLVGISRPLPSLFDEIAWSTDAVMAQTRMRLTQLGVTAAEMTPLHDIDLPADLIHVPKEWLTNED
jgi:rSAM/selenodomain-associated transferase 1